MDRYKVAIAECGTSFVVTDKETGEAVYEGNKTQVEEWLDVKENQLRWQEWKSRKRWYHRFFNVAA